MDENTPVGERIRHYRRRRGLTQEVLAGRAGMSRSWLQKVESGERVMDRISVLLLLANVLKVAPGDLIGGVSLPPNGGGLTDPPRGIHAIRRAILAVRPPDRELPIAAELRAQALQAKQLRHAGRYEAAARVLPELITDARAATAQGVEGGWWCLAAACQVGSALARITGEGGLAWIAADRSVTAAQHSGDALMVAVSEMLVAQALLRQGLVADAGAVCSDAADALSPTEAASANAWSLWGALKLDEAVIAARSGAAANAWGLLRGARAAAERLGRPPPDYWSAFCPANVGAYEVSVALEVGDVSEARRCADRVDLAELTSDERRGRFCIHVARAHTLHHDDGAAVALLLEGERHAPEEIRYSVQARELVRVCLSRERRARTPGLRGLAERIGVAD